ncbi:GGDEF domain-containing protein [Hoeflea olei]|uniref:diguanylate cyclase n=1 Tax=Hoeflea olei TaxID=1480615 RepID=A0A1C1YYU0_9HYPH|nr:GGDEF domain-containing protein [Hoeflea olei]OCW58576.1 hypothetical protein AWJ14_05370 [Hoeflea olei]
MNWIDTIVAGAQNWIIRQLTLGEFESPLQVWRKATLMACKIAVLAYAIDISSQALLAQVGLLPYTLMDGFITATMLTPAIAFSVAVVAYAVIGFAIYDLSVSRAELELLSRTDVLSGLANRRSFLEQFEACDRDKVLMVVDIDRFKFVNDRYGHAAGDEVIVKVGATLSSVFAGRGVCGRIGGEEFAVFSAELGFAEFTALGELARIRIAGLKVSIDAAAINATISGGVTRALPGQSFRETFSRADKALYAAKALGRDRIELCYDTGSVPEREVVAAAAPRASAG